MTARSRASPPEHRNIGVVFQNYALFPHMTVFDNVGVPAQDARQAEGRDPSARSERTLDMVHLTGLGDRLPRQLSGGQQQRVALARALVFDPGLLLMDEPLGALDRNLREQMKLEIKRIHSDVGVTVLYVTHDQEEALTMSDRIALMNRGRIAQLGSAEELYERPASLFVARFIGESNLLEGRVESADGGGVFIHDGRRAAPRASRPAGMPAGRAMHAHGAAGKDHAGAGGRRRDRRAHRHRRDGGLRRRIHPLPGARGAGRR